MRRCEAADAFAERQLLREAGITEKDLIKKDLDDD